MNYGLQKCHLHTTNQLNFFLTWSVTAKTLEVTCANCLETIIRLNNQVAWQIWTVVWYIESTVFVFNSNIFYLLRK